MSKRPGRIRRLFSGAAASALTFWKRGTLATFTLLLKTKTTSLAVGPFVVMMGQVSKIELAKGGEEAKLKLARLAGVGASALDIAYEHDNDAVAKDLATAAMGMLIDAIKAEHKPTVEGFSRTFVKGLLKPRGNPKYKKKVDELVDERRRMFNEALVHEKNGTRPEGDNPPTADELAMVATSLLVAAVDLQIDAMEEAESTGYLGMVHYFSGSWVEALEQGIRDGCELRVRSIVGDRTNAFSKAMKEEWKEGGNGEAEILSEAAVEVLLRAVEHEKRDLVEIFSESWVEALERAINDKQDLKARVEAMVNRRTAAFVKALGQGAGEATTLSGAGVAVLLSAIKKGNAKLILSLSRSWVKALNAKGVRYGPQVAPLIELRTNEFNKAIATRDVEQAKILSKAGMAVLLAAVEDGSDSLVHGLSDSWVSALGRAITQFEGDAATRDEVVAEAVNFGKGLIEGGVSRKLLEDGRSAIMRSAADERYKGVADLVNENWKLVFSD